MVHWDVRIHGRSGRRSVLQTRHDVSVIVLLDEVDFNVFFSIQTWALKEARARLEAKGEAFEYKPAAGSPAPPEGSP